MSWLHLYNKCQLQTLSVMTTKNPKEICRILYIHDISPHRCRGQQFVMFLKTCSSLKSIFPMHIHCFNWTWLCNSYLVWFPTDLIRSGQCWLFMCAFSVHFINDFLSINLIYMYIYLTTCLITSPHLKTSKKLIFNFIWYQWPCIH